MIPKRRLQEEAFFSRQAIKKRKAIIKEGIDYVRTTGVSAREAWTVLDNPMQLPSQRPCLYLSFEEFSSAVEAALNTQKSIGARIRELRKRAGLTIEELAAKTGISERSVSAHEAGQKIPRASSLGEYQSVFEQELGIKLNQNLESSS